MELNYDRNSAWELSLLALCVWREAANQGFTGMLAVAWSIRNRVKSATPHWWGSDWEEVIEKPWQYTSMEKSDPNATKLPMDPKTTPGWDDALVAAERAYLGLGVDPTCGATHYYNPKAVSEAPGWVNAAGTVYKTQIGDHLFYKAN